MLMTGLVREVFTPGVVEAPLGKVGDMKTTTPQFEQPHGLPAPIGQFGLLAAPHIYKFGTTPARQIGSSMQVGWRPRRGQAPDFGPVTS